MSVRATTPAGDWTFGRGRANYRTRSAAIQQKLVTRLRMVMGEWFADTEAGVPWYDLLGVKGVTEAQILRKLENTILTTEGIRSIQQLQLLQAGSGSRDVQILVTCTDMFDTRFEDVITPP